MPGESPGTPQKRANAQWSLLAVTKAAAPRLKAAVAADAAQRQQATPWLQPAERTSGRLQDQRASSRARAMS